MNDQYILGLQCGHNGSVSLVKNRKLIAHIDIERLTRKKSDRGITKKAIRYVLDIGGIKLKDVSFATITNWFSDRGNDGKELFDKSKEGFSITFDNGTDFSQEDFLKMQTNNSGMVSQGIYFLNVDSQRVPCFICDHHFSHCASAFYLSPFTEAVCVSIDFSDNLGTSHSVYYINDEEKIFKPLRRGGDFGIGSFYGCIVDYLGFYPSLIGAGKVMAVAAYGEKSLTHEFMAYDNIDWNLIIDLSWPNVVKMGDIFHGDQFLHLLTRLGVKKIPDRRNFYPQLKGEGGVIDKFWLNKDDWNSDLSLKIAFYAQKILEVSIQNFLISVYRETKMMTKNICLSGGTMLNCTSNGKLLSDFWYSDNIATKDDDFYHSNIFIPPNPGDNGLCMGSAMFLSNFLYRNRNDEIRNFEQTILKASHTFSQCWELGKKYSSEEISVALEKYENDILIEKLGEDSLKYLAELLSENNIIAISRGRSESGPRALGNRSVLASPISAEMKDKLNRIKDRETFRPVSPMIMQEYLNNWFEYERSEIVSTPFMSFALKCKYPEKIPSAVHIDGTSRTQTVNIFDNEFVYKLIKEFYNITNIPMVINTSFNLRGEPLVETPEEAIKAFLESEIDYLILENYLVTKRK